MSGTNHRHFVIMGVAGCGKTTVGKALARHLGARFIEGDAFHPSENTAKMVSGVPLTDEDRWPWLSTLAREVAASAEPTVVACSALKRAYRNAIVSECGLAPTFIHLSAPFDQIEQHMRERKGHFMPLNLLESQFATLEPLHDDEHGIIIPAHRPVDDMIAQICGQLALSKTPANPD